MVLLLHEHGVFLQYFEHKTHKEMGKLVSLFCLFWLSHYSYIIPKHNKNNISIFCDGSHKNNTNILPTMLCEGGLHSSIKLHLKSDTKYTQTRTLYINMLVTVLGQPPHGIYPRISTPYQLPPRGWMS